MAKKETFLGTGRRKRSIAQVVMKPGKGNIVVNGQPVDTYFPFPTLVMDLKQPLVATHNEDKFDIEVTAKGGGFSGQAGATRLGITRALLMYDADTDQTRDDSYRKILKVEGFVRRDPRIKERKKYGLKKARRAPQFSKR